MSARDVLIVGGPHDGTRVPVLFGDSVRLVSGTTGEAVEYRLACLRGATRDFWFGVVAEKALDGDWLIERLAKGYLV